MDARSASKRPVAYVELARRDSRWLALSFWLLGTIMATYGAVAPWVACSRHVSWIVWQPPPPAVAAAYVALGVAGVTVMSAVVMAVALRRRYLPRVGAMMSAVLSGAGAVVAAAALASTTAHVHDAYGYDGIDIIAAHMTVAPWLLLGGLLEASIGGAWLWQIAASTARRPSRI